MKRIILDSITKLIEQSEAEEKRYSKNKEVWLGLGGESLYGFYDGLELAERSKQRELKMIKGWIEELEVCDE